VAKRTVCSSTGRCRRRGDNSHVGRPRCSPEATCDGRRRRNRRAGVAPHLLQHRIRLAETSASANVCDGTCARTHSLLGFFAFVPHLAAGNSTDAAGQPRSPSPRPKAWAGATEIGLGRPHDSARGSLLVGDKTPPNYNRGLQCIIHHRRKIPRPPIWDETCDAQRRRDDSEILEEPQHFFQKPAVGGNALA